MSGDVIRIAVALSGGVDSSVTALLLHQCVHRGKDLTALWSTGADARHAPPPFPILRQVVRDGTPWSQVVSAHPQSRTSFSADAPVVLAPFYMHNWRDSDARRGWCVAAERDYADAQAVAHALGLVPPSRRLPVVDLSAAYADRCFDPMLLAYARGDTCNVDVLCNREIKFGALVDEYLGWHRAIPNVAGGATTPSLFAQAPCALLATGHYARTIRLDAPAQAVVALLARPRTATHDLNDQTLFLAQVRPSCWPRVVFPLGHVFGSKADVRRLCSTLQQGDEAEAAIPVFCPRTSTCSEHTAAHTTSGEAAPGNHVADRATTRRVMWQGEHEDVWTRIAKKKTSTGLCFVGDASRSRPARRHKTPPVSCSGAFTEFLREYIPSAPVRVRPPPLQGSAHRQGEQSSREADALAPTRFVELVPCPIDNGTPSYTEREIPPSCFRWGGDMLDREGADDGSPPHAESLFAAHAFTIGQRLRCFPSPSAPEPSAPNAIAPHPSGGLVPGKSARSSAPRTLYVVDKALHPLPPQASPEAALRARHLATVRLVAQWNHPLLYARHPLSLRDMQWHLDAATVACLCTPPVGAGDFALLCQGCTRHLEPLRDCRMQWSPGPASTTSAPMPLPHAVSVSVVGNAAPFRAISTGQLFVAYLPLRQVQRAMGLPPSALADAQPSTERVSEDADVLVVVASGWIEEAAATPLQG